MGTEAGGEGGSWGGGHLPRAPGASSWRPVSASEPAQQHEQCDDQEIEDKLGHLHHGQHRGAKPQAPLATQVGQEGDHRNRGSLRIGFIVQLLEEDVEFGNSISFVLDRVVVLQG